MINKILMYVAVIILCSCQDFAVKKQIVGKHYIIATDVTEDANLSFETADGNGYGTLIEAMVFAVGQDKNFIIAKQHPRVFPHPPDETITNYFILPIRDTVNWQTANGLLGPLNEGEYHRKRIELGIQNSVKFMQAPNF